MQSLAHIRSSQLASARPTGSHMRSVLQKMHEAADRPVPPATVVTVSAQASGISRNDPQVILPPPRPAEAEDTAPPPETPAPSDAPADPAPLPAQTGPDGLTEADRALVMEMVQRDREVHAHEAAHQAAGGGLVGAASYSYQVGPDGRSYANGGECPICIPSSSSPAETIAIAQRVRAAALAPASPSGQDFAVASAAVQMEAQARLQLAQQQAEPQPAPSGPKPQAEPQTRADSSEPDPATPPERGAASRALAAYARASELAF